MDEVTPPSVNFNTLRKSYTTEECILVAFTVSGFTPTKKDWVGIFEAGASKHSDPIIQEWIPAESETSLDNDEYPEGTIIVTLKTSKITDEASTYEVRYYDKYNSLRGNTEPFHVTLMSKQESLITMQDGDSCDDSLVLIEFAREILAEHDVYLDTASECESATEMVTVAEQTNQVMAPVLNTNPIIENNESHVTRETEIDLDIEGDNTPLELADLREEIERRVKAENALEKLSKRLGEQMCFIDHQQEKMAVLKNECKKEKYVTESLKDDFEMMHENTESYITELDDIRAIATNYKIECSQMKKKIDKDEEFLERLKLQLIDDRDQHEEEILKLKEIATEEIEKLRNNNEILEEALEHERLKSKTYASDHELAQGKHDTESKKKDKQFKLQQSQIETLKKDFECLREKFEKHAKKDGDTIRDLESRVCNESSRASRLQNDLEIAENRHKEATEDIKFFRHNFIETEQKLQKSQLQQSKVSTELVNLRNIVSKKETSFKISTAKVIIGTAALNQQESNKENVLTSKISEGTSVEEKSSCESICPSTCASNETLVSVDRRRVSGDVTDFTDDESLYGESVKNWGNESMKSQSLESLVLKIPDIGSRPTAGLIHLKEDYRNTKIRNEENICRAETDPTTAQTIAVITSDVRRTPKKNRRRYSKPIDLSLSPYNVQNHELNDQRRHNPVQQFTKDVTELGRETLEKQYLAIRQHRNSLLRESTFLKNRVSNLKTDMMFMNNNLQNIILEAEHKIGILSYTIYANNVENPFINLTQPENDAHQLAPRVKESQITKSQQCLSPYAAEYTPSYPQQESLHQSSSILTQEEYFDYISQQADNGYYLPLPPTLPHVPLPPREAMQTAHGEMVDVSQQLVNIGVSVTN